MQPTVHLPAGRAVPVVQVSESFMEIPTIGFKGPFRSSDSGQFRLGWEGSFEIALTARKKGRIILLSGDTLLWQKSLQDPVFGVTTDAGYIAVHDGTFSETPSGVLYILSPNGEELVKHRFRANIDSCGFSDDDSVVCCTTLASERVADSCKMTVFSVLAARMLFKRERPVGNITRLAVGQQTIQVTTDGGIEYRCSLDGTLLNEQAVKTKLEVLRIKNGNGYDLLGVVQSRLSERTFDQMSPPQRYEIVRIFQKAQASDISDYCKLQVCRMLGEYALSYNEKGKALIYFQQAIELNPKAGVKRKIKQLQEELPTSG